MLSPHPAYQAHRKRMWNGSSLNCSMTQNEMYNLAQMNATIDCFGQAVPFTVGTATAYLNRNGRPKIIPELTFLFGPALHIGPHLLAVVAADFRGCRM